MKPFTTLLVVALLALSACAKTPPTGISREASPTPHLLDETLQAIVAERPAEEHHYSVGGVVEQELVNRLTAQLRSRVNFDAPETIPPTMQGLGFTCSSEASTVLRCDDSTIFLSYMPGYFGYMKRREVVAAEVTIDRGRRAIDTAVNIRGTGY